MMTHEYAPVAGIPKMMQQAIYDAIRAGAFHLAQRRYPDVDAFPPAARVNSERAARHLKVALEELQSDRRDQGCKGGDEIPAPDSCERCSGYHTPEECVVQDLVAEIVGRYGQAGLADRAAYVSEVRSMLMGLGASPDAADKATARWVADDDA